MEIYQGDNEEATSNNFLGRFVLKGIPKAKAHKENIDVKFSYDMNGMLQVEGTIVSTGEKSSIAIDMTGNEEMDVTNWKEARLAIKFRSVIRKAEKMLGRELQDDDRQDIEDLVYELKKALLLERDEDDLIDLEDELLDIIEDLD